MHQKKIPITVLMAAYNAEKYLSAAIESILNQSFSEFELLIINDGSTDGTGDLIASYRDGRIRCIKNKINLNLCRSLANGVSLARGDFIARMDADDIAHPARLERQLAAMLAQPDLDLLGTNVRWIDHSGKVIGHPSVIADPIDLKWNIFFRNCFNHPTVMIRKSALERHGLNYGVIPDPIAGYLPEQLGGIGDEDYLLFGLICNYGKAGNLDEVLLDYRIHGNSLTALFSEKQSEQTKRISSALQAIYSQHSKDMRTKSDAAEPVNPRMALMATCQEINSLARKMQADYVDPVAQRRIETQRRLWCAIAVQGQQSLWRRILIGMGLMFNRMPLQAADFPILLKYIFGDKLATIFKRYLRLCSL
jgi:glycosyltransferase involved in cell wall biosynthesis